MPDFDRRPNVVDVLLQEYSLLKSEINFKDQSYERQITYAQFAIAALVGTLAYLFNGGEAAIIHALGWPPKIILALAGFVITAVTLLLVFKTLESDFRMQVVAARMAMIEKMINDRIGDHVMHWESFLCEEFTKIEGAAQLLNPSLFLAILYFVILLLGAVVLPFHLYWHAWYDSGDGGPWLGWVIVAGIAFTVVFSVLGLAIGVKIHSNLRPELRSRMTRIVAEHVKS